MLNHIQRRFRLRLGFLLVLLFPLAWILKYFHPHFPGTVCFFKTLTGKACPFCGLSRALSSFMHGAYQEAFKFHAIWWLAVLIIFGMIILLLYEGFTGDDRISTCLNFKENFFWIFVFFALLFFIIKG